MKQDGYQIICEALVQERVSLFRQFLTNSKYVNKKMLLKIHLWFRGGKINPIAHQKIKQINDLIYTIQTSQKGKIQPIQAQMLAKSFGIDTKALKDPQLKQSLLVYLKKLRIDTKTAVRLHQQASKKLVVGAGVVPPVVSTGIGVGATAALSRNEKK